jgi:predicted transcriptional regulator of viral defense system
MTWKLLQSPSFVVFTTRDFALAARVSISSASQQLARHAARGSLVRITRGVWANTDHAHFSSLVLAPLLLGAEQGYVSFLTALHMHAMLSQIPTAHYIATTGTTRRLQTPVGRFEFLHIQSAMMRTGIEWSTTHVPYRMAMPEKALLDTLYISTRKGRQFRRLPEIALPRPFARARFSTLARTQIADVRIRRLVMARFEAIADL